MMKNLLLSTLFLTVVVLIQACTTENSENKNPLITTIFNPQDTIKSNTSSTDKESEKVLTLYDRLTPPSFESKMIWQTHGDKSAKHNYMMLDYDQMFIDESKAHKTIEEALKNPLDVKYLFLKYQKIGKLPTEIVQLQNVERIFIIGENFINFSNDLELLAQLPKLRALELNSCHLKSIPPTIAKLKNLEIITLYNNSIVTLPNEICDLEHLLYLNLYNNRTLKQLPDSIGKLKNLEFLAAAGTNLKTFPESIGNCNRLLHITANAAKLEKLPHSFGNLENLIFINFGYNKIKELPETFGNLPRLRIASLGKNKLKSLPKNFGNLENLITCNLEDNLFTHFPMELLEPKNLSGIALYDNQINYIPLEVANVKYLKQIVFDSADIRQNNLDSIAILNPNIKLWKWK
ncbi:MAG: hypothetical protein JJT94_02145 [Bernardetiaceae bacterium]|nr:hypothetical protein [Bernardetiaceae bacterium]